MIKILRPARRILNRLLDYPDEIVVEPTNNCNLNCPACASRREEWTGERGYVDISSFMCLVDEIKERVMRMAFVGRGEPLLHPQIFDMVRYAHDRGFKTLMLSNGTLLNSPKKIEQLVNSGLDRITMGLDGLDQHSYEMVRRGGKVDDVFGALSKLTEAKQNGADIKVHLHFLMTRFNEGQLSDFKKLKDKYDIDSLSSSHIMVPGEIGLINSEKFDKMVRDYVLPDGLKYHCFTNKAPGECSASRRTSIRYNGDMQLCCRDTIENRGLGNVFEEGFFKVWRRNQIIRKDVKKKNFPVCTYCSRSVGYERQNKI